MDNLWVLQQYNDDEFKAELDEVWANELEALRRCNELNLEGGYYGFQWWTVRKLEVKMPVAEARQGVERILQDQPRQPEF